MKKAYNTCLFGSSKLDRILLYPHPNSNGFRGGPSPCPAFKGTCQSALMELKAKLAAKKLAQAEFLGILCGARTLDQGGNRRVISYIMLSANKPLNSQGRLRIWFKESRLKLCWSQAHSLRHIAIWKWSFNSLMVQHSRNLHKLQHFNTKWDISIYVCNPKAAGFERSLWFFCERGFAPRLGPIIGPHFFSKSIFQNLIQRRKNTQEGLQQDFLFLSLALGVQVGVGLTTWRRRSLTRYHMSLSL